jgi:hypothetical protein
LNILIHIIINLLVFGSWYLFLFRFRSLVLLSERLAGTFVFGLAQIIVTSLLLGAGLKTLYPVPLLSLNLVISISVLAYSLHSLYGDRKRPPSPVGSAISELGSTLAWLSGVLRRDYILALIFALFVLGVGWIIFLGYLFPSYTWDALWYHLPIVGYMMQNGAIQEIPNNTFIHQFINIFPKNIELFFLWNIIFLKTDRIVDLSQLPFVFIGMMSVYSIALKSGIEKRLALYPALLFFFTPILILQASTNYVDVAISSLFITAVNFLSGAAFTAEGGDYPDPQRRRAINLTLAGITSGILLGAKGSGPLFIIILSGAIIAQKLRKHLKPGSSDPASVKKSFKRFVLNFIVPVILLGGYWYLKNWIIYDNPVYPMEVSILGKTVFKGLYKGIIEPVPEIIKSLSYWERPLYVWLENVRYYLYDSRLGGLGPIWFILFLPSVVLFIMHAVVSRNFSRTGLALVFVAAFLLYPRNWTPRYVIFLVAFGALSFGWILTFFEKAGRLLRVAALILACYTLLISNSPCITPEQIIRFISLPAPERTIARHKPFNIDLHARQEYGHWIWISNNVSAGDVLAYTFDPLFLAPLWNSSFSNRITYIKAASRKEFTEKLREERVRYVLIKTRSREDEWITTEMKVRSSLGWFGGVKRIYRVRYQDENYKIIERTGQNRNE